MHSHCAACACANTLSHLDITSLLSLSQADLGLGDNALTGTIPTEFGKLNNLGKFEFHSDRVDDYMVLLVIMLQLH